MTCSKDENSDLFYSIPWSHGTLGFVVSVELMIIRAKRYVDLIYLPYHTKQEAVAEFAKQSREAKFDFVECLAYSKEEYVVMLGNLTDSKTGGSGNGGNGSSTTVPVYNPIGLWYKEWFYKHVERYLHMPSNKNNTTTISSTSTSSTLPEFREIIPLRHYYHRHSRSLFWEVSDIVPFGNNPLFRALLGWMMPPKPSLLKLTQTEALRKLYELHHMVRDCIWGCLFCVVYVLLVLWIIYFAVQTLRELVCDCKFGHYKRTYDVLNCVYTTSFLWDASIATHPFDAHQLSHPHKHSFST